MKRAHYISLSLSLLFLLISIPGGDIIIRADSSNIEGKGITVRDIDGNVYRTVRIGSRLWMAENLKVTHYRDGTPIPNVYDNEKWPRANNGAYCMVDDSLEYKDVYGLLYNYHAVNDSRGLSPEGWHVPTADEWRELIDYLGGEDRAGGKMKEFASNLWKITPPGASNESGFSALPAGGRGQFGSPSDLGDYGTWWSSTSHDSFYAWHWGLFPDNNRIRFNPGHKSSGFSVRCIKDR